MLRLGVWEVLSDVLPESLSDPQALRLTIARHASMRLIIGRNVRDVIMFIELLIEP